MMAPKTLVAGEMVRFDGKVWTVSSVFNTNTEGHRASIVHVDKDGNETRMTAPFADLEVL